MAHSWLRLVAGATLSFVIAGHALADEGKITVFAAASLTNAMQDIAAEYKKGENVDVVSSFASSSTLARPDRSGARRRISSSSADQKWMDYAADKKAVDTTTRETLLGNSLVVVAPKASEQKPFTIDNKTDWIRLLNGGRLAVGDPQHVPAGIYAKEALQKWAHGKRLNRNWRRARMCAARWRWSNVTKRLWGIVYGSDAVASKGVNVGGDVPEDSHKKSGIPHRYRGGA
ncbi:molybdate-binding periplasmic protein [Salmonella enterica subsp. enterica]|nr:molybdate-binding periplasmic protein [Salmonella enterica subsp. enterica]